MKYCLSGRQNKEYIQKADEIKVQWRDRDAILDFIDWNPEARIILVIDLQEEQESLIKYLKKTKILCKDNFAVVGSEFSPEIINELNNNEIKWFFIYPAGSFAQLRRMQNLGASDAYITGELCHSLDKVERYFNINIRVFVNSSGEYYISERPILNGFAGSWFRPEDINDLIAIDVCEFAVDLANLKREQALYRIYAERKEWPGQLNDIIEDIYQQDIINRLIEPEFQAQRSNCGMKCAITERCNRCEIYCKLASEKISKKIKEQLNI